MKKKRVDLKKIEENRIGGWEMEKWLEAGYILGIKI